MKRDSYLYTILFTFVLSALFSTALAITQAAYLPIITQNEENVQWAAIFKVLDITPGPDQVIPATTFDLPAFVVHDVHGEPVSYAFALNGQGLWGSIRGYIGISASFDRLLGLEFVEQNETPGLGGRIDEPWFKEQFRDTPLIPGKEIVYGPGLDAITGATASSNAVLHILNETILKLMPLKEVMGR